MGAAGLSALVVAGLVRLGMQSPLMPIEGRRRCVLIMDDEIRHNIDGEWSHIPWREVLRAEIRLGKREPAPLSPDQSSGYRLLLENVLSPPRAPSAASSAWTLSAAGTESSSAPKRNSIGISSFEISGSAEKSSTRR